MAPTRQRSHGRHEGGRRKSDEDGHIDTADLAAKAAQYKDQLAGLMVTYPSTHAFSKKRSKISAGLFTIMAVCVYGCANMNAQVGLTSPA